MSDSIKGQKLAAGGAATTAGIDFQNRISAWFAVRILAEKHASPLWGWPASSSLEFIRCETEQPVDDLMVGDSEGRIAVAQIKHSVSLEKSPDSPLGKTISQFVRQYLRSGNTATDQRVPWQRGLDSVRDRFLLIAAPTSSQKVVTNFPAVMERVRMLPAGAKLSALSFSEDENEALLVIESHIEGAFLQISQRAPNDAQLLELLSFIRVCVIDVDANGKMRAKQKRRYAQTS